ncbi:MAG: hypothetical protein ACU836_00895 [Gammaproteobacteria bacterium]
MTIRQTFFTGLIATNLFIAGSANAAPVNYEISGDVAATFRTLLDDPIADLLEVPRNSTSNLPFTLKLVIDTDNVPYIENDTATFQEVIYRDAIVSASLNLNGTIFETLRRPQPAASVTPPPLEESRINVINRIDATSPDQFAISLYQEPLPTSDLFNGYVVPFNQTINGTFFAESAVQLNIIGFLVPSAIGLFQDYSLPEQNGFLTPVPIGTSMSIQLRSTTGGAMNLGSFSGIGTNYTFQISPAEVPIPSAIWLFASGGGLLGFVARRTNKRARHTVS